MRIRELPVSWMDASSFLCRALRECEPKAYRNFHQHLNTTKYTEAPVYNVLYDAIDVCIHQDIA